MKKYLVSVVVLLVVIAGSVGYIAFRQFAANHAISTREVAAARADIDDITKALDMYKLDTGEYPSSWPGLQALIERPSIDPPANWSGPYLKKLPLDPWGKPYNYAKPGKKSEVDVFSSGPDMVRGTADDVWPDDK